MHYKTGSKFLEVTKFAKSVSQPQMVVCLLGRPAAVSRSDHRNLQEWEDQDWWRKPLVRDQGGTVKTVRSSFCKCEEYSWSPEETGPGVKSSNKEVRLRWTPGSTGVRWPSVYGELPGQGETLSQATGLTPEVTSDVCVSTLQTPFPQYEPTPHLPSQPIKEHGRSSGSTAGNLSLTHP